MGGVRVFMYFTIQSNIAIDCATGIFMMFRGKRIGSVCHQIRGDSSHHADRCCICRSAGPDSWQASEPECTSVWICASLFRMFNRKRRKPTCPYLLNCS